MISILLRRKIAEVGCRKKVLEDSEGYAEDNEVAEKELEFLFSSLHIIKYKVDIEINLSGFITSFSSEAFSLASMVKNQI